MKDTKVQWHLGFVSAIDLEFAKNRSDLTYHKEYNLNKQALEADLLAIKENSNTTIDNEIGKLFRRYNIMEYKSPEDHLNIDTLYKVEACAGLYKSYGTTVDERKADEITVSLIRENKPVKLFEYFKEHEIRYTNPYRGGYYVLDKVLFPTQIIVTKELNPAEHMWLTALSAGLEKQQLKKLLEKIESFDSKLDRELADSVLEVTVNANWQIVEELRGDEHMCQALLEIMEPEINKIKEEAVDKERQKGIKSTIIALRDCGQGDEEVKRAIIKVYGISANEAEEYL